MKIKPILFNTEMVKAILAGRKTMTRRVFKDVNPQNAEWGYTMFTPKGKISCRYDSPEGERLEGFYKLPYQKGDTLYVRETWNYGYFDGSDAEGDNSSWFEEFHKTDGEYLKALSNYIYRADFTEYKEYKFGTKDENGKRVKIPWHPSIHMPKEAARIWLKVTDVRVERLQDITENDIEAEGANLEDWYDYDAYQRDAGAGLEREGIRVEYATIKEFFASTVWNTTLKSELDYEKYGWDANPWVWVVEFERCEKPEEVN